MTRHPYLRAYMAGLLIPSWVLLLVLSGYLAAHFAHHIPDGLERAIMFPMAVVPNLWGLWNVLYLVLGLRRRVSVGVFGALLPVLLVPAGLFLTTVLDLRFYTALRASLVLPTVVAVYY